MILRWRHVHQAYPEVPMHIAYIAVWPCPKMRNPPKWPCLLGKWWSTTNFLGGSLLSDNPLYNVNTLWWTNSLLLNMAIEIVDFPINSMVIFHGKMLVHQAGYMLDPVGDICHTPCLFPSCSTAMAPVPVHVQQQLDTFKPWKLMQWIKHGDLPHGFVWQMGIRLLMANWMGKLPLTRRINYKATSQSMSNPNDSLMMFSWFSKMMGTKSKKCWLIIIYHTWLTHYMFLDFSRAARNGYWMLPGKLTW